MKQEQQLQLHMITIPQFPPILVLRQTHPPHQSLCFQRTLVDGYTFLLISPATLRCLVLRRWPVAKKYLYVVSKSEYRFEFARVERPRHSDPIVSLRPAKQRRRIADEMDNIIVCGPNACRSRNTKHESSKSTRSPQVCPYKSNILSKRGGSKPLTVGCLKK